MECKIEKRYRRKGFIFPGIRFAGFFTFFKLIEIFIDVMGNHANDCSFYTIFSLPYTHNVDVDDNNSNNNPSIWPERLCLARLSFVVCSFFLLPRQMINTLGHFFLLKYVLLDFIYGLLMRIADGIAMTLKFDTIVDEITEYVFTRSYSYESSYI